MECEPMRYKARFIAKGFIQYEGIDFTEVFLPIVKYKNIRLVIALVVQFNWKVEQMDVKTTFLHVLLEEDIYMMQPDGYVKSENLVCKLEGSLYGMKQSPCQWNKRFDGFVTSIGINKSGYDSSLYFKGSMVEDMVMLLIYVDDMFLVSKEKGKVQELKM